MVIIFCVIGFVIFVVCRGRYGILCNSIGFRIRLFVLEF